MGLTSPVFRASGTNVAPGEGRGGLPLQGRMRRSRCPLMSHGVRVSQGFAAPAKSGLYHRVSVYRGDEAPPHMSPTVRLACSLLVPSRSRHEGGGAAPATHRAPSRASPTGRPAVLELKAEPGRF